MSTAEIANGARTYLRDFPQYFEVDEGPIDTLTIRLPQPLVMSESLQVYLTPLPTTGVPDPPMAATKEWQLDERNGLLKLTNTTAIGQRCLVGGYHYTWFSDSELQFHASKVGAEMAYSGVSVDDVGSVEADVMMLGTVVSALWSLSIELSLDIDVSTPEGMYIPARQRFMQVSQMLQYFQAEYSNKAAMLNIGLNALEQWRLRRVSYMTGRYVPVYLDREYDDPRPPERIYPAIPDGVPGVPEDNTVEVVTWASLEANSP